ncbi:MAG TPA: SAM-dependent methyltransferase [Verrucomicrobia bacterium]|nr:MAG: methyltransferase type 11 [Lentisphaerae bacterium GWF2_57_35]HBA83379.1 SAM-dependent methyltransferase [Verrucomicrobiota bacterium]
MQNKYVHGYTKEEAGRLLDQSSILEEFLHSGTRFADGANVLEAGCGVGAQTEILVRRSPGARFTSVDISNESLALARERIQRLGCDQVVFQQASLYALPFGDSSFDHVFVCFVLEHLDDPSKALLELKRVLKPGGTLTVIEGDHGSCFWHPETPLSVKVWRALIEAQQELGHNPSIGRELYPLLAHAGYQVQEVAPRWLYADALRPALLDGMVNKIIVPMVETAQATTLRSGTIDQAAWDQGIAELSRSGQTPDGTFFYTWFKAIAAKE